MLYVQVFIWQMKKIYNAKKYGVYVALFIEMIFAGTIPFITLYIPRIIIDGISYHVPMQNIMFQIIGLCMLVLLCSLGSILCNKVFHKDFVELRHLEMFYMNEYFQTMDYHQLENEQSVNDIHAAMHPLFGMEGFQGVYMYFAQLLPIIFSLSMYFLFISLLNIYLALFCIFCTICSLLTKYKISSFMEEIKEKRAKTIRQKDFFNKITFDHTFGKDIRVFQIQDKVQFYCRKKVDEFIKLEQSIANKEFKLQICSILFGWIRDIGSYSFMIYSYSKGYITIGQFTMYIGIILAFTSDIETLLDTGAVFIKCITQSKIYKSFVEESKYKTNWGSRKAFSHDELVEIACKNISFSYTEDGKKIIDNLSFTLSKNEKLAIIGLNGAGKSTLIKILLGLLPIQEGEILINGISMYEFDRNEYFKMISVVFQDISMYALSVLEYITGDSFHKESMHEVNDIIESLQMQVFIRKLPKGLDTQLLKVLDDEGVVLSGGESQMVSFARALYKNGNIMVLDEPTAALDALAEEKMYQLFNDVSNHKTSIFISHRLSTTRFCDKVLLLSEGKIKEYGTHDELMRLKKEYYRMFMEQAKYYRKSDDYEG